MKNIVDILLIVLPALIIVLGLLRLFSRRRASVFNGLIMLFAIMALLAGAVNYLFFRKSSSCDCDTKMKPLSVSKHSEPFNNSVQELLGAYYDMTESFVNWDTGGVNANARRLKGALDSLNLDELRKDTTGIYETALQPLQNARAETESILQDPSIAEKRASFNILSDNIRQLLAIVKFDRSVIYWMECSMAFGEDKPANWLSKNDTVRNPYLGIKDPKYGSTMLTCGEPKAKLDFTPKDTNSGRATE